MGSADVGADDRGDPLPTDLAKVVGINARRIRGATTGSSVAQAARRYGLNWGTGRISDLEAGRVTPALGTLIAVAAALQTATGEKTTTLDLVRWDGLVTINPGFAVFGTDGVVRAITGGVTDGSVGMTPEVAKGNNAGESELRAANSLGIEVNSMLLLAEQLWGRSLPDERDMRAGELATAQKRGRVTRQLIDELRSALKGTDGDDQ